MRFYIFLFVLIAALVIVQSTHTFLGTNVLRPLVYHKNAHYSSKFLRKRVENITYYIPPSYGYRSTIQGILAYDLTDSSASANVTAGGLGFTYVTLRMKSARGKDIHYDISIYT